ncbi:MAG: SNF2 helicase-associated domain-containing protein [Dehalococcoidia bacterium]|nr:SNF2 helicase-associated domain-containing protein [Dehalococcoidia bacterium]
MHRPTACEISLEEAYGFLRESAPLLEEAGFGVLAPPRWQQPVVRFGARLRVRPKDGAGESKSVLGLQTIVEYDWEVSLGEEKLGPDEFEELASLKAPLVQVRGQWAELRPLDIEAARLFLGRKGSDMTLPKPCALDYQAIIQTRCSDRRSGGTGLDRRSTGGNRPWCGHERAAASGWLQFFEMGARWPVGLASSCAWWRCWMRQWPREIGP